ncbi:MAG TPA: prolyl oligopeptidase family serine peptidase [Planctomycetaceae bacterium]|nr:prolyl oligopeptidase family serine peptidase [Planctomycetaceae bacterium]
MRFGSRSGLALLCMAAMFIVSLDPVSADGPADNQAENVRRIPKLGVEVSDEDRAELNSGLKDLQSMIEHLQGGQVSAARLLPDVEIYYRAVRDALEYQEFFDPREVIAASNLLLTGKSRAAALLMGKAPWQTETGAVIRGYRSKIDHSAQPYAVYVPADYRFDGEKAYRCDLWFHGRGETLSEVNFITQRERGQGAVSSNTHFMVHPYGRYSNANKFAGEIDTLEILDHLNSEYRIDEDRIAARGFSMGGAACWQFAVHYPDRWFAATPSAGFSETPEFLKVFQQETLTPTWYEQKLWQLYNCTDHAINLYHCPTIAYSGEIDRQKQAADIMEEYLRREGIDMIHIIGPNTAHKIHPDSLVEIERRLSDLEKTGRERNPNEIHFKTFTLRYNSLHWVTLDALQEHWAPARIDAKILAGNQLEANTTNIADLTFSMPAGSAPFDLLQPVRVSVNGQIFDGPRPKSDRSWECSFYLDGNFWKLGARESAGLKKKHALQGPIDDAFMDSFIIVEPTSQGAHEIAEKWSQQELAHAVEHWRRHFRGHPRVKQDSEISEADIADANLVLFGTPFSNQILAKIADKLPILWTENEIRVGEKTYSTDNHALIAIFPNPLNPERYIVLNSGFTFREYDYLNNARQVPKLPDWAIVDLKAPLDSRGPGKIVDAGFFGENWELKAGK